MNKLTKLLSVFVIAGAVSTSMGVIAGCEKNANETADNAQPNYTVSNTVSEDVAAPAVNADENVNGEEISLAQGSGTVLNGATENETPVGEVAAPAENTAQETVISTVEEFLAFRTNAAPSGTYKLGADIDLSGVELPASTAVLGAGVVFDGQGYTVSNGNYANGAQKTGLLCASVEGGTVTNVKFLNCVVSVAGESAGIVAGLAEDNSTFTKIEFNSCSATANKNYVGLVFARNSSGGANITIEEITAKNDTFTSCAQYGGFLVGDIQGNSTVSFKNLDVAGEFKKSSSNGSFIAGRTRANSIVSVENAVIKATVANPTKNGLISGNGKCKKLVLKNVAVLQSNTSIITKEGKNTPDDFTVEKLYLAEGITLEESNGHYGTPGATDTAAFVKDTLGLDFTNVWMEEGGSYRLRASSTNVKSPDATLTSLKVNTANSTVRYKKGTDFSAAGVSVMGVYSDGVQLVLKNGTDYTIDSTAFNKDAKGEYTISIVPTEDATKASTYKVTVVEETGYKIYDEFMTRTYIAGGTLDPEALVVKSVWSDGVEETIPASEYTIDETSYDMATAGAQEVKVTYKTFGDKYISISVVAAAPEVLDGKVHVAVDGNLTQPEGTKIEDMETFKSLTAAIDYLENSNLADEVTKVVHLSAGTYTEKITTSLNNLALVGEGKENTTVTYSAVESTVDILKGQQYGMNCGTIHVNGTGFKAYKLSIRNDFDYINDAAKESSPQGLALTINGDGAVIEDCLLYGNQDTLYVKSGRVLFKNTEIQGNVDFICGGKTSLVYFDNCTIKAISRYADSVENKSNNGYVVAVQANDSEHIAKYGYIFNKCAFTDDGKVQEGAMSLGRPWGQHAAVAMINCSFTKAYSKLAYDGKTKSRWFDMSGNSPVGADFCEYGSTGEGAITEAVNGGKVLTAEEAANYTKANLFAATNGTLAAYDSAWDCDAAAAKLPTLVDKHTYSEEWSYDYGAHWHEATDGSDAKGSYGAHEWDNGVIIKKPTEREYGVVSYTCKVCGKKMARLYAAGEHLHIYGEEWKHDETNHWHECVDGDATADLAEHEWVGKVEKPATETETGIMKYTCSVCGATKTEVIPKVQREYNYNFSEGLSSDWTSTGNGTTDSDDATPVTGLKLELNQYLTLNAKGTKATIELTGFTRGSGKASPYITIEAIDAQGNVLKTIIGTTGTGKLNGPITLDSATFTTTTEFVAIRITCNKDGKSIGITSAKVTVSNEQTDVPTPPTPVTKYTVTYKLDYEGAPAATTEEVEEGKKATAPADPTREGYTFDGWYNGDTAYNFDTPVTGDLELTAHWTANAPTPEVPNITEYQVPEAPYGAGKDAEGKDFIWHHIYFANANYNLTITKVEATCLVNSAERNVYEVLHDINDGANHHVKFRINATANESCEFTITYKNGDTVVATGTYTYTAPTPAVKYTVKFDLAYEGATAPTSVEVEENGKVTKPADPTREGYTFVGWYKGDTAYDFNTAVTANLTLTAHWTEGEAPAPEVVEITTLTTVNDNPYGPDTNMCFHLSLVKPAGLETLKTMKVSLTANGETKDDIRAAVIDCGDHYDIHIYDTGYSKTTTVTADIQFLNEAGVQVAHATYTYTATTPVDPDPPTPDVPVISLTFVETHDNVWMKFTSTTDTVDCNFVRVNGQQYGSTFTGGVFDVFVGDIVDGKKYDFEFVKDGKVVATASYTYTASTPVTKYTVTYNLGYEGAPAATTEEVEEGKKATAPAAPTREGYIFTGWYNGETAYDFNTAVTANLTLTAHWALQTSFEGISAMPNNRVSEDFSGYTEGDKLPTFSGTYGTAGVYSDRSLDTATGNYVKVAGGVATQEDGGDGMTYTVVDFGRVKGKITGCFTIKLDGDKASSGWTMVHFIGDSAAKSGSEVLGLRSDSGLIKYRFDGDDPVLAPATDVSFALDTAYEVYFEFNPETGAFKLTINGNTVVDEATTTITSIYGIRLASTNSNSRVVNGDDIAISGDEMSVAEYQAQLVTKLTAEKDKMIAKTHTQKAADVTTACESGITAINGATTYEAVLEAYNTAVGNMNAVQSDEEIQLNNVKTTAKATLNAYKDAANYTEHAVEFNAALQAGLDAIDAATTEAEVETALAAAKAELDNVPDDSAVACVVTVYYGDTNATIDTHVGMTVTQEEVAAKVTVPEGQEIYGYFTAADYATAYDFTAPLTGSTSIYVQIGAKRAVVYTYSFAVSGKKPTEPWSTTSTSTNKSSDATPVQGLKLAPETNLTLSATGTKATIEVIGFTTGSSKASAYLKIEVLDAQGNVLKTLTGTTLAGKLNGTITLDIATFTTDTPFASIRLTCGTSGKHVSITSATITVG